MCSNGTDSDDLLAEKSLFDVYKLSRKVEHSRFNLWTTILVAALLCGALWCVDSSVSDLKKRMFDLAQLIFGFSINVLGFLLAGFTIFATITKPDLLLFMHTKTHERSGLSYLKYNFSVFFRVFAYYLFGSFVCGFIMLFYYVGSDFVRFAGMELGQKVFVLKTMILLLGVIWCVLLLSLKSFIFNIYHVVMTALKWESELSEDR